MYMINIVCESTVVKKLAIARNIDSGDLLLLVAFGQDTAAILQRMKPAELFVVSATEKPVGKFPSTFIELKTHFYLGKTKVTMLPLSSLAPDKLSRWMASLESYFDRISELVLDGGAARVSFRGIVIKSTECMMPTGKAVRSIIADESGTCVSLRQFNGKIMRPGTLTYCRYAQVFKDRNDHHVEATCVSATYIASNLRLITAPQELQDFYRDNDMTDVENHHNRSSCEDLQETTIAAMVLALEVMYDLDAKAKVTQDASAPASSSSSSDMIIDPESIQHDEEDITNQHVKTGLVTLKLARIMSGAMMYYNACTNQSLTNRGESTCNKAVSILVPGEDWLDHKDRPAGKVVHKSKTCTQRFVFTAVFEEEIDGESKEYSYKVFDEFGTTLMQMEASEWATLSTDMQDQTKVNLANAAVYVVTINRNGVIENMQTTENAGD